MVKSPIQGNNPQKLRIDLLVQEIIASLMNATYTKKFTTVKVTSCSYFLLGKKKKKKKKL